jgi:hypothetical protein
MYVCSGKLYTWCDNLIPGIVTACHWGVESGKLVYSSTVGHVPNDTGGSRKGENMCKTTQEVGSQKREGQMQM